MKCLSHDQDTVCSQGFIKVCGGFPCEKLSERSIEELQKVFDEIVEECKKLKEEDLNYDLDTTIRTRFTGACHGNECLRMYAHWNGWSDLVRKYAGLGVIA